MKIRNYNNDIRRKIAEIYSDLCMIIDYDYEEFSDKFNDWFEILCKSKYYKYILGILYSTAYTILKVKEERGEDISEFEDIDFLEDITSLRDLELKIEMEDFDTLCNLNDYFFSLNLVERKDYFYSIKPFSRKIIDIFPMFILDLIHYTNSYDSNEIMDNYYCFKDDNLTTEENIENIVKITEEHYLNLHDKDIYNYNYIISDIIDDFYKYNYYLKCSGISLNEDILYIMNLIDEDVEFFIEILYKNKKYFDIVLKSFFEYNLIGIVEEDKIDKFYSKLNKENSYSMVLKKTNKIRNPKNN